MLEGKTALVTGGSSGIGRAIVERYLDEGAAVVVADVDEDRGERVAADLGCGFVPCDVREYERVEAAVERAVDDYGALDVLVNDAGVASEGTLGETALDDWERVLAVDLNGVMYGTKAALPHLEAAGGAVVNIASIYGLRGGAGAAAYCTAKGGVVNLTRQVAVDYADRGVRVNSICPGVVETPMTAERLDTAEFQAFVETNTPMGRPADPTEIAPLAAFLASDEASYITGANVPVDGGWTAH